MFWFAYIARARTGRYYVGITDDVEKRIQKHNSGKGSKFAINQGPFVLVYTSPEFQINQKLEKGKFSLRGGANIKKKNSLEESSFEKYPYSAKFL